MFDIEALFSKQHPDFYSRHPFISRVVISCARWLWKEKEFREFAAEHKDVRGLELIEAGFQHINFDFVISEKDRQKIPEKGRVVLIANHPLGCLDGLGLLRHLGAIRPDIKLILNNGLYNMLDMKELTIPVDNFTGKISKSSLKQIHEHLDNEGMLIMFPSGLVSPIKWGKIEDHPWNTSFYRFAQQKNAPILPVYIEGKNSVLFYVMSIFLLPFFKPFLIVREILMMKLIREMVSGHNDERLGIIAGEMVDPAELQKASPSIEDSANIIRGKLLSLKEGL